MNEFHWNDCTNCIQIWNEKEDCKVMLADSLRKVASSGVRGSFNPALDITELTRAFDPSPFGQMRQTCA